MNKKILLVEDDLQMQALIVDYLKDYGFIVTAFDNPKDVLEDFKLNSDYSIIILDLMLPFMALSSELMIILQNLMNQESWF